VKESQKTGPPMDDDPWPWIRRFSDRRTRWTGLGCFVLSCWSLCPVTFLESVSPRRGTRDMAQRAL